MPLYCLSLIRNKNDCYAEIERQSNRSGLDWFWLAVWLWAPHPPQLGSRMHQKPHRKTSLCTYTCKLNLVCARATQEIRFLRKIWGFYARIYRCALALDTWALSALHPLCKILGFCAKNKASVQDLRFPCKNVSSTAWFSFSCTRARNSDVKSLLANSCPSQLLDVGLYFFEYNKGALHWGEPHAVFYLWAVSAAIGKP